LSLVDAFQEYFELKTEPRDIAEARAEERKPDFNGVHKTPTTAETNAGKRFLTLRQAFAEYKEFKRYPVETALSRAEDRRKLTFDGTYDKPLPERQAMSQPPPTQPDQSSKSLSLVDAFQEYFELKTEPKNIAEARAKERRKPDFNGVHETPTTAETKAGTRIITLMQGIAEYREFKKYPIDIALARAQERRAIDFNGKHKTELPEKKRLKS